MTVEWFSEQKPAVERARGKINVYLDEQVNEQVDEEGGASTQYGYAVLSFPATASEVQMAAAVRYHYETKGLVVNGLTVATDDRSKTLINGKWNRARVAKEEGDEAWACRFKSKGGWVELDADQMIEIGLLVEAHVQSCFDREGEICAAIDAGEGYDIRGGWPEWDITTTA